MKVLVCGGRDYSDFERVVGCLNQVSKKHGIDLIIEGGAKGADSLGAKYAKENGIPLCTFHANWSHHGKYAGPKRNKDMIKFGNPDCVVAFSGGIGTKGMVKLAKEAGISVWEIE